MEPYAKCIMNIIYTLTMLAVRWSAPRMVVWETDTPTDILPKEVQDAFKVLMTHWILQFA